MGTDTPRPLPRFWSPNRRRGNYYIPRDRRSRIIGRGRQAAQKPSTLQSQNVSTYGLNSSAQTLAEIGAPIPVAFGERTNSTGGFVHTPLLIYQRMHSAGAHQWTRVGFVMGEGRFGSPPERGIRNGSDLIHSIQPEFYELAFNNGRYVANDPTYSNTVHAGNWSNINSTLTGNLEYFTIQAADNKQERGFSQSFDPNKSFGLEGEEPDCETSQDSEFSELLPYPTTAPHVKFNPIDASISNTRKSDTTEFGFAVNMPRITPEATEESGTVPIGSKWKFRRERSGASLLYELYPGGSYDSTTGLPFISAISRSLIGGIQTPGVFDKNTPIQVISPEIAFYALYRSYYGLFPAEDIAIVYAKFLATWGSASNVLFIRTDESTSSIYSLPITEFLPDAQGTTNWTRTDGQFSVALYDESGDFGPCSLTVDSGMLSDIRVPKLFFKLFYRKIDSANTNWKPVFDKPFCLINPNTSTLFADLRIRHSSTEAYEYKFKPMIPVQVESNLQYEFFKWQLGIKSSTNNAAQKVPVLYPSTNNEFVLDGNDGFKLIYSGFYEQVTSEVKLDDQTTDLRIGVSYVNEGVVDQVDYPFMSTGILTLRAGKGVSSLGQFSAYYENGAQIQRTNLTTGASNKFPDLCYHLLTYYPSTKSLTGNRSAGPVKRSQIDVQSFLDAISYTRSKSLFYDGVIYDFSGVHEFISEHAKFFCLRFGIRNGLYSLFPALLDSATNADTAAPGQVVTGDIIDSASFRVDYAPLIERDKAFVTVIWRRQDKFMPGVNETVTVAPSGYEGANRLTYDLSGFCTSETHAEVAARFMLAMRLKQDRTASFTCAKSAVDLSPGRLFKFDFSVSTSSGRTYANQDQYQVTSTTYREDGLLDVRAVYMASGTSTAIFSGATYPRVS